MKKQDYQFAYEVYDSITELDEQDALLLTEARSLTGEAYAPYSKFHVAAVARLMNGETVKGTNQENASYPVGICAERSLLSTAAALYPGIAIDTIAISYKNHSGESTRPISPCGMCRQSLVEYEERVKKPIRLILSGQEGAVIVIEKADSLLPFSFGSNDLK